MQRKLLILGFVTFLAGLASCSSCEGGKNNLLALIPADVPGAVVLPNLAKTVGDIKTLKDKFSVGPMALVLTSSHNELKAMLGFDPLQVEELKKLGLAPENGLAMVPAPEDEAFIVLGISDRKVFEAEIKKRLKEAFAADQIQTSKQDGLSITSVGSKIDKAFSARLHYAFDGKFALLAGPNADLKKLARLPKLKTEESLLGASWYKSLTAKSPVDADVLVVVNGQKAEALQAQAGLLKQYMDEGMALAVGLAPNGLSLDLFVGLDKDSASRLAGFAEGVKDEHLERYLPADSVAAIKLRLNIGKALDQALGLDAGFKAEYDKSLAEATRALKTDVEAGTVRNLTGNFIMGLSLGKPDTINRLLHSIISQQPPTKEAGEAMRIFAWAQVQDAAAWLQILDNVLGIATESQPLKATKKSVGGLQAIQLSTPNMPTEVFLMNKGDLIGVCAGNGCLEQSASLISGKGKKLPDQMSKGARKLFDEPSSLVSYLNFTQMREVVQGLDTNAFGDAGYMAKMAFGMAMTVLQNIKELSGVVRLEDGGLRLAGHLEIQ